MELLVAIDDFLVKEQGLSLRECFGAIEKGAAESADGNLTSGAA